MATATVARRKTDARSKAQQDTAPSDPLWYKDAVIYQLHVRAFCDSNQDGIGDFAGLTQKLDYLQDLGATVVWLLPFYPSPLKDDGYDIADYRKVHPSYGTLRDFTTFLREAHARGLRVVTELVLNHTSDQHLWFQRARHAPAGSAKRDFYVWSDTPEKYQEARIIFQDFELSNWSWDPVAKAYYWHRFYSHQPDLNFDNPQVRAAATQAMDFWFKLGVDGLRLDAIPYLFEREGTNCENLPETHVFLKQLRRHVDEHYPGRMFLAEANQWPEDAVAYFGEGDECHTAFHFPVMPRLFMGIHMEDRYPIVDILQQTPEIPDNCQWVMFLRNHDELTLEMVTDEERDYMYRVYALDREARINLGIRRRLAPLLGNNRRKIELMNGLLLSLPGTPVIYYGDEIGMGDNIFLGDRDGVRTPMQWSSDRNAGFSRANPQKLYLPAIIDFEYHYESVNVETQRNNPHSLWWWMKRLIAIRQLHPAFGRGALEFLTPENAKVLAFLRTHEDETILVVANLSRFSQFCELDLSRYHGLRPMELFGRTKFPRIGTQPYLLTLGPFTFHWFLLKGQSTETRGAEGAEKPRLIVAEDWTEVFLGGAKSRLERALPAFLQSRRWFGGKAREIQGVQLRQTIPMTGEGQATSYLTLLKVDYFEGEAELYVLPLAFAVGDAALRLLDSNPGLVVADLLLRRSETTGVLYDATAEASFGKELLEAIVRKRRIKTNGVELRGLTAGTLARSRNGHYSELTPTVGHHEQSNSSITFGDRLIMKLLRRVEAGEHPDWEVGRFLTEVAGFPHAPPIVGALELAGAAREPLIVALLHEFVPNQGTAWKQAREALSRYLEQDLAQRPPEQVDQASQNISGLVELTQLEIPRDLVERTGGYLSAAQLLGTRTGEMHLALAGHPEIEAFSPEPFTQLYQRSRYQSLRKLAATALQLLRKQQPTLSPAAAEISQHILGRERDLLDRFQGMRQVKIQADRIRCHGDYHLGQVLFTGKDYVIMDFEGEPARALGERRLKRSALIDVAGMIRSIDYVSHASVMRYMANQAVSADDEGRLRAAAARWRRWTSGAFLKAYLGTTADAPFVPRSREQLSTLLGIFLLEKALYELQYELNNRPDWVEVPLRGIQDLLDWQ